MKKVVGISFKEASKIYWFNPNFLKLKENDFVVVETVRGLEIGKVVSPIKDIDENKIQNELKNVIRIASNKDLDQNEKNLEMAKEDLILVKKIVKDQKIDMKVLDCEYTLDSSKLLIYYTAEGRVDFRELVKILAAEFKVRIELRQIGDREGTKLIGGLGPCGRELCCKSYMRDFDLVTMKMAKDQGMSLSSTKISGTCGKLMCCIAFEEEAYKEKKDRLPEVGDIVKTESCPNCKVISCNLLTEEIQTDNNGVIEKWNANQVEVIKTYKKTNSNVEDTEKELED